MLAAGRGQGAVGQPVGRNKRSALRRPGAKAYLSFHRNGARSCFPGLGDISAEGDFGDRVEGERRNALRLLRPTGVRFGHTRTH